MVTTVTTVPVKRALEERYGLDVALYVEAHLLDVRYFTFWQGERAIMHNGFVVTSRGERLRWVSVKPMADGEVELQTRCGRVRVLHPSPPFALGRRFKDLLAWVDLYWKSVVAARAHVPR